MPNLRVLDLNAINVNFLMLSGCPSLESINLQSNQKLVKLDLSGTKIKRFPLEGDPNVTSLRNLDLLGVKNLCNVNWDLIQWLPVQLNWDQCGEDSKLWMYIPLDEWFRVSKGDGVFVSVCDANIFRSLAPSSLLWTKGLLRFVIYIHSHKKRSLPPLISSYNDVNSKLKPCVPLHERCLEIEGDGVSSKGIHGVLSHTNFLYLHDVKNLKRLPNLGIENMGDLRECWLERCQEMKSIFDIGQNEHEKPVLSCIETVRISDLKKLSQMFLSVGNLPTGSFSQLKQLQLQYCPQLVVGFSSGFCLENLEVLEIKFCARLEEVFSGDMRGQGSLQRLHTLLLWELPCLYNIVRTVSLLSLKKAQIKGCPNLRKLPLQPHANVAPVVVIGEIQWWEQLEWDDNGMQQPHISFNAWKPFELHKTRR